MADLKMYQGDPNLAGGRACLNFANTVGGRRPDQPREYLHDYGDLVAWSRHAGLLSEVEAQRLVKEAEQRPVEAAQVLAQAIALREAIYRIFSAIAAGISPLPADITTLNNELTITLAKLEVRATETGFSWGWRQEPEALDVMLWPVARSAGELLTSADLARVRECAGDRCGWLFLDLSRNHSRRWCAMNDCGNRAKAKRHYQRSRTKKEYEV
ncbi:MAG: ABATE domain-containing protein [Anaerolineae bacterium]